MVASQGDVDGDAEYSGVVLDGRYRVLRRLGQGGMGTVYAAEHVGLGQRRAIKFLRADLGRKPGTVRRFLQEARVLSGLHHEHLVAVVDMGEYAGTAYYVMELLDGEDLRARLRRVGALCWADARTIALQVANALGVSHARGIVHRDLKPENCFCLSQPDASLKIKLIDFGVAKVPKEAGGTSQLTGTGEALGTVGYMAPEQMEGQGDHRVDVYSLGAMVFEMLAGRPLYRGNAYEVISKMLLGSPPRLRDVCPGADPTIEALIARAIDRDPERRFATMADLAAEIRAIPADAPPIRTHEHGVTHLSSALAVDGEATTLRPTDEANERAIDPNLSTLGAANDRRSAVDVATLAPEERSVEAAPVAAPEPALTGVPTRPRRWWLLAAAALPVAAVVGLRALWTSGAVDDGPVPPLTAPRDPMPAFAEPELPPLAVEVPATAPPEPPPAVVDAPETVPEPPPVEPPASKPTPPSEPRLTRPQLKARIERELRACKPELLDEEVTIRVTPGKTGALEGLAPVSDAHLAPGIAGCIEQGLARVRSASKDPLAVKKAFDIRVVLAKIR